MSLSFSLERKPRPGQVYIVSLSHKANVVMTSSDDNDDNAPPSPGSLWLLTLACLMMGGEALK